MPTEKEAVIDRLRSQRVAEDLTDVVGVRDEWVRSVSSLMERLRLWLSDAEKERLFDVSVDEVTLKEIRLGSYPTLKMTLVSPKGEVIRIAPRARYVVGAYGRVDLKCPPREAILVRDEPDRWRFARLAPASDGWVFEDLNEETFWKSLGNLLGA